MAKGNNQKLKLSYLSELMQKKTDDTHYLTMPEIIAELEKQEVSAERKSIYADFQDLEKLGIEVEGVKQGKQFLYHVISRKFELPELKLLVDAIQSSKFITVKKSGELIKKLETLCSDYEASQLQRQVFIQDRIKTMNESIYYTVDAIHNAISENKKIKFKYFQWNIKKEMELKHDGEYYTVSPWGLIWDNENYYLVAYDSESSKIKHYRVDKMLKIEVTEESREGSDLAGGFNSADYSKRNFEMFGGEEKDITVELDNAMCGVFIDRFGKDITFVPIDRDRCSVRLRVALSRQFLGWIWALGDGVRITGPTDVVEWIRQETERIYKAYKQ